MSSNYEQMALSWVREEVNKTLDQARLSLEAFVDKPEDATQIRFCVSCLHQVRGTLQILEFYGAALLAEEMEQLAVALSEGRVGRKNDAHEILMGAILQLPSYLERVQAGSRDVPMVLLPILNELRAVRGESLLSETAIFNPSLNASRPKLSTPALADAELKEQARKLRPHYQKGLLGIFRSENIAESFQRLAKVMERLELISGNEAQAELWWVVTAFLRVIDKEQLYKNASVHGLLGQIDKALKALGDEGLPALKREPAPELMKNLLYYIAKSPLNDGRVAEVKSVYELSVALPAEEALQDARAAMAGPGQEVMKTVVVAINEDLASIKDALDVFMRTRGRTGAELGSITPMLRQVSDTLAMLGLGLPRDTVQQQLELVQRLVAEDGPIDDAVIMNLAGNLVTVEANLTSVSQGMAPSDDSAEAGAVSDVHFDEARRTLLLESRSNLQKAKDAIIDYMASHWDVALLEEVPGRLNEVRGGLVIVGLDQPATMIGLCNRFVQERLQRQRVPTEVQMDALADILTSIEYFLEAREEGSGGLEPVLDAAAQSVDIIEVALAEALPEPKSAEAKPTLELLDSHDEAPTGSVRSDVDAALAQLIAEPAPAPVVPKLAEERPVVKEADESLIDDEVIEIFLEEAEEVLETIRAELPRWIADPDNKDALSTTRRSFHTLKGSGRLVGAKTLGEFAWSIENLFNRIIDETVQPGELIFATLEAARDALPDLINGFREHRAPTQDVDSIARRAEQLAKPGGAEELLAAGLPEGTAPAVVVEEAEAVHETVLGTEGHLETPETELAPAFDSVVETADTEPAPEAIEPLLVEADFAEQPLLEPESAQVEVAEVAEADIFEADIAEADLAEVDVVEAELPAPELLEPEALEPALTEFALVEPASDADALTELAEPVAAVDDAPVLELIEPLEQTASEPLLDAERAFESAETEAQASLTERNEVLGEAWLPEDQATLTPELVEELPAEQATPAPLWRSEFGDGAPAEEGLDPVLLDIFRNEAESHFEIIDAFLADVRLSPVALRVSDALVRALHTLKGSANMAEVGNIAELVSPTERYFRELQTRNLAVSREAVAFLRELRAYLSEQLELLTDGATVDAERQANFLTRIHELQQSLAPSDLAEPTESTGRDPEMLSLFMVEAMDVLEGIELLLDGKDRALLASQLASEFSTLRMGAGMARLPELASLAGALEQLCLAKAEGPVQPAFVALAQAGHDRIMDMLDKVAANQSVCAADDLLAELAAFAEPAERPEPVALAPVDATPSAESGEEFDFGELAGPVQADSTASLSDDAGTEKLSFVDADSVMAEDELVLLVQQSLPPEVHETPALVSDTEALFAEDDLEPLPEHAEADDVVLSQEQLMTELELGEAIDFSAGEPAPIARKTFENAWSFSVKLKPAAPPLQGETPSSTESSAEISAVLPYAASDLVSPEAAASDEPVDDAHALEPASLELPEPQNLAAGEPEPDDVTGLPLVDGELDEGVELEFVDVEPDAAEPALAVLDTEAPVAERDGEPAPFEDDGIPVLELDAPSSVSGSSSAELDTTREEDFLIAALGRADDLTHLIALWREGGNGLCDALRTLASQSEAAQVAPLAELLTRMATLASSAEDRATALPLLQDGQRSVMQMLEQCFDSTTPLADEALLARFDAYERLTEEPLPYNEPASPVCYAEAEELSELVAPAAEEVPTLELIEPEFDAEPQAAIEAPADAEAQDEEAVPTLELAVPELFAEAEELALAETDAAQDEDAVPTLELTAPELFAEAEELALAETDVAQDEDAVPTLELTAPELFAEAEELALAETDVAQDEDAVPTLELTAPELFAEAEELALAETDVAQDEDAVPTLELAVPELQAEAEEQDWLEVAEVDDAAALEQALAGELREPLNLERALELPASTGVRRDVSEASLTSLALSEEEQTIEQELVEIFLEEADELLESMADDLLRFESGADEREVVAELQRELHTLKGSARMAGVSALADLAHAMEDVYEAVGYGRKTVTPALIKLSEQAHARLMAMVSSCRAGETVADAEDLIAAFATYGEVAPAVAVAAEAGDGREGTRIVLDEGGEEILGIYLEECAELVEALDDALAELAGSRDPAAVLALLQRHLHTLKGGARLSDLSDLGDVTHALESMFEGVVEGRKPMSPDVLMLAREGRDAIVRLIQQVTHERRQIRPEFYLRRLEAYLAGEPIPAYETAPEPVPAMAAPAEVAVEAPARQPEVKIGAKIIPLPVRRAEPALEAQRRAQAPAEVVRVRSDVLEGLVNLAGETSIYRSRLEQQVSALKFNLNEMTATIARLREQLRNLEIETEAQVQYRREITQAYEDFDPLEMDRYTRQSELTRQLSESSNDLLSLKDTIDTLQGEAETLLVQQGRVNTELQEGLMRTRMVPFETLVPRLKRIVKQLNNELGKDVELAIFAEGEMDRTVAERMIAPIEHMLRNAMDHGIESTEARRQVGKAESGRIRIRLFREGGEVIVEIADDGAGINLTRVRAKAIERGIISEEADLTEHELQQLILEAGFSTAEKVTQISGRGVGMDVVNSEIRSMGGVIDIHSVEGEGSRFTVRLPFTVSVNQALMVKLGEDIYAIPLSTIEGIVRVSPYELAEYYQTPNSQYNYAGLPYSLKYLGGLLDHHSQAKLEGQFKPLPVLLLHGVEHPIALQVDDLMGSREIVVKSVGTQLSTISGLSGATILGDGRVVLILDVAALLRRETARVVEQAADAELAARLPAVPAEEARALQVMVVDDSITVRKVTTRLLERHGYEVITAKDGVDAVNQLHEIKPDIMLLDIEMPRMDGFELATVIRHDERLKDLPIIMITSRTGEKHRNRAEAIGVERFMGKPFDETELLDTIAVLLGR